MKKRTKVVLSLVLLLCAVGIAVPLGVQQYYSKYGEYYYKTLIVSKEDAAKVDKKVTEVKDCGDFSIIKYRSMKATGEAVGDLYSGNAQPFIIDTDMTLNAGLIEDVEPGDVVEDTALPAKSKDDIVVAVVDTGFNPEESPYSDRVVKGIDLTGTGELTDQNGHGTIMSNIILQYTGQNVKVMPVKVMAEDGCRTSTLFEGMLAAIDSGADVVNVSMSSLFVISGDYSEQICEYAKSKNVPVVVAAGNNNMNTFSTVPANNYSGVVVSAIDENKEKTGYSNNGDNVDFCSYGAVKVYDKYACGTSVSAALVSSVIAENMRENYDVEDFEKLLMKQAEPLGEEHEVVTYGFGMIIPNRFSPIEDEQSKISFADHIQNLPWKDLDDDYLNYVILNQSSDYELAMWLQSLSDSDTEELLSRNTVLREEYTEQPVYRGDFVDDTTDILYEDITVDGDPVTHRSYYDYYKDIELDSAIPVCTYSKMVVKLRHRYNMTHYANINYDDDGDKDDDTSSGTTFTYFIFDPKKNADEQLAGEKDIGKGASREFIDKNPAFDGNGGLKTGNMTATYALIGGDFRFCDKLPITWVASDRICTNDCSRSGTTPPHRHANFSYKAHVAFYGLETFPYSFVQANLKITKNMTVHSRVSIQQRTSPEGNIIDILDRGEAYPTFSCTHDSDVIYNLGLQVGVCQSCKCESDAWYYRSGSMWKLMSGDDLKKHEGTMAGGCAYGGETTKVDGTTTYHVDSSGVKVCKHIVASSSNVHGPFSNSDATAYGQDKATGQWHYPMFTVLTQSNALKTNADDGGCNFKENGSAVCKVCSKAGHVYTESSDYKVSNYSACNKGVIKKMKIPMVMHQDESVDWKTNHKQDGTFTQNYFSWICGRTGGWKFKKDDGTIKTKDCKQQMLRQIYAGEKHRMQGADGSYGGYSAVVAKGPFNVYVGSWNNKGALPEGWALSPDTVILNDPATAVYNAATAIYSINDIGGVVTDTYTFKPYKANPPANITKGVGQKAATNYEKPTDVTRRTYNLNISVVNDTPYPSVAAENIVTISGSATDQNYPSAGARPVLLGDTTHFCSGGGKLPNPSVTDNAITATATVARGYKFVGWYAGSTLLSTNPTYKFNMPASDYAIQAHVIGVKYKVRLYGNKLDNEKVTSDISAVNNGGFTYPISVVNTANGPTAVKQEDYKTWSANTDDSGAFYYETEFQVGNASCALPDVDKYCYKLPGYEAVVHKTVVYPNVGPTATGTNSSIKVNDLIVHTNWCWYLYTGQNADGVKGTEPVHPFKDQTGTYDNGIYKGCNDHIPSVMSWDLQLEENGYANLYPVWTPIEYGIYYDKNTRVTDQSEDRNAMDGVYVDGATGGLNPYTDSFDDVLMVYQYDEDYVYPVDRWTRDRGWAPSSFSGWSDHNEVQKPGTTQKYSNFKWEFEENDPFRNLTQKCGTDYHLYAIFNDTPYVKAADIYDRNGNIAKLAQEVPGSDGTYVVSKTALEEYVLSYNHALAKGISSPDPTADSDVKNRFFSSKIPTFWYDRELGKFKMGNYDEPDTFNAFGGRTHYWIEFMQFEDMGNLSGADKDFIEKHPDYIIVDPSEHDVATFELHYSIQDEFGNYYTVTQKLYAGLWRQIYKDKVGSTSTNAKGVGLDDFVTKESNDWSGVSSD